MHDGLCLGWRVARGKRQRQGLVELSDRWFRDGIGGVVAAPPSWPQRVFLSCFFLAPTWITGSRLGRRIAGRKALLERVVERFVAGERTVLLVRAFGGRQPAAARVLPALGLRCSWGFVVMPGSRFVARR